MRGFYSNSTNSTWTDQSESAFTIIHVQSMVSSNKEAGETGAGLERMVVKNENDRQKKAKFYLLP